jgi:PRTRC genetic system protein B
VEAQISLTSTRSFELREALLVYKSDRNHVEVGSAFVTRHEVVLDNNGAASLKAGTPIGYADLKNLLEQLQGQLPVEFLPANVLVRTQQSITWWAPPTIRPMFYATEQNKEVAQLSGKRFPQPGLVLRAEANRLDIRAVAGSDRPTPETRLYRAPYWNVSDNGNVCLGSTRVPTDVTVALLPRWESSFFESEFTHPNAAKQLITYPGGFIAFWRSIAGKRRFPVEYLADAGQTLARFMQS